MKIIKQYIKKYPEIEAAGLFGSRARGNYKEGSDVDIVIYGERTTNETASDLKFTIEEESYLPYFFDVICYNSIDVPALKEQIDKYGVVIYKQKDNTSHQ